MNANARVHAYVRTTMYSGKKQKKEAFPGHREDAEEWPKGGVGKKEGRVVKKVNREKEKENKRKTETASSQEIDNIEVLQ